MMQIGVWTRRFYDTKVRDLKHGRGEEESHSVAICFIRHRLRFEAEVVQKCCSIGVGECGLDQFVELHLE
jgi:hypothetical protein